MYREAGFTLVELIVTIVVVGLLLTVAVVGQSSVIESSRDNERADDIASIARVLEDDYTNQIVGSPSYPSTGTFLADIPGRTGTATANDKSIFIAPNQTSNSVVAASGTGAQTPTINQYVYQPIASDGSLCTGSSQTCITYTLWYKKEAPSTTVSVVSAHQQ